MKRISGSKAIVTGGTRGIGLATVKVFAEAGAEVTYTGTSQDSVETARGNLGNVSATGVVCDMRDADGMREVLSGGCDILINNAAITGPGGPLHAVDDDGLHDTIAVTLSAAMDWARHAARGMLESGGGTIVNLSSGAARHAIPNMGPYCVAKAGLLMATQIMHAELQGQGVRVLAFSPGVVDTDMQTAGRESGLFDGILPSDRSELLARSEPARAMLWLCEHAGPEFGGRDIPIAEVQQAMAS